MRLLVFLAFVLSTLGVSGLLLFSRVLPSRHRKRWNALLLQHWSKKVLKLFRIHTRHFPSEEDLSGPRVIVANHVSYLDIPILLATFPNSVFIAKEEVSRWPLLGWMGKQVGMVFVKRENLWSRARSLLELQERLQNGQNVVIFPEGSTSEMGPRKGLSQFFSGAFRIARMEDSPLEMLYLEYSDLPRCAWLGEDAFLPHLWQLYSRRGSTVKIRSHLLSKVHNRRHQHLVHRFCRTWLLEGGHGLSMNSSQGWIHS